MVRGITDHFHLPCKAAGDAEGTLDALNRAIQSLNGVLVCNCSSVNYMYVAGTTNRGTPSVPAGRKKGGDSGNGPRFRPPAEEVNTGDAGDAVGI